MINVERVTCIVSTRCTEFQMDPAERLPSGQRRTHTSTHLAAMYRLPAVIIWHLLWITVCRLSPSLEPHALSSSCCWVGESDVQYLPTHCSQHMWYIWHLSSGDCHSNGVQLWSCQRQGDHHSTNWGRTGWLWFSPRYVYVILCLVN